MPSDPIDELFADILTPQEIEQSDNLRRAMVDRLAQALAQSGGIVSRSTGKLSGWDSHALDCIYMWADQHITTLGGNTA